MAKQQATAKKGPVKAAGTAMQKWDAALAARAKLSSKVASNIGQSSNFISFKGGLMAYKGNPVEGNAMDIVVPSFILENQFYDGVYDPETPASPVCYAFGSDPDEMKPHEKSAQPQHEQCKGCPHNEWGSAEKGRGKACKNVVRLGVIPADAIAGGAQGVKDAEEAVVKLPVTSCKNWGGFVSSLEAANLPPLAFVTEMKETPDAKTQFKITFQAKEQITDGETLGALLDRAEIMDKTLAAPYPDFDDAPAQPQRSGRAPAKAPLKAQTSAGRRAMVGAGKPASNGAAQPRRKF